MKAIQLSVSIFVQTGAGKLRKYLRKQICPTYGMHKLDLNYTTMTQYDHKFKNVHVVFENDDLKNTLGEILQQNGQDTNTDCRNRKISSRFFLL